MFSGCILTEVMYFTPCECEGSRFPRWHTEQQQGPIAVSAVKFHTHKHTAGTLQSLSVCHITSAYTHYAHTHPCPKRPHECNQCAKRHTHTHTHIAPIHTPRPRRHTRVQSDISRSYHPTLSQQTQSKTEQTHRLYSHTHILSRGLVRHHTKKTA